MNITKSKYVFKTVVSILLLCLVAACDSGEDDPEDEEILFPENAPSADYYQYDIETDKAIYDPGDVVLFSMTTSEMPDATKVRYMHLSDTIEIQSLDQTTWTWTPPVDDFKGYTAVVYQEDEVREKIYATIGIDVSSDWTKYPRYGFLSDFGMLTDKEMSSIIENLNRYHINALQFYDWHNKHHMPLPTENGVPKLMWKDIINRDIYFETVEAYIQKAHSKNMDAMMYNLIYGAWDYADEDGVQESWYAYKDNQHRNFDFHPLSSPFISNIYVLDPSNEMWQSYQNNELAKVYTHLDFDGFHMDQLGDRGDLYHFDGSLMNMANTFEPFIDAIKAAHPTKKNVMNAVNQYGVEGIAKSSSDLLYTEVWSPNMSYNDLANILLLNNSFTENTKNSVLAAYMNYGMANTGSYFNTAAVLMTDAVIFAFGGAHLELGEHMLCQEYFPNNSLTMKEELRTSLIEYYDFLVSYQNILRNGGSYVSSNIRCDDNREAFNVWPPIVGSISTISKQIDNKKIVHFLNFTDANTLEWRDDDGVQSTPALITDLPLIIENSEAVKKIWAASPDDIGGASRAINFTADDNKLYLTLPELKYWTMLVIEYEDV